VHGFAPGQARVAQPRGGRRSWQQDANRGLARHERVHSKSGFPAPVSDCSEGYVCVELGPSESGAVIPSALMKTTTRRTGVHGQDRPPATEDR
jgi:hypothetical protein